MSLVLTNSRPSPDELIAIRVAAPVAGLVGLDSALDRWTGREWKFAFLLLKARANKPADYFPAGSGPLIPDIGLPSEQSWPIRIPREAKPGKYRIREEVAFSVTGLPNLVELSVQLEVIA